MTPAMKTIIYPVANLDAAKTLYAALLGVEPYADEAYYVGFRTGDLEVGLDPNGHKKGMTGPIAYWEVDDIAASMQRLVGAGASEQQPPTDVGGGTLIATVTDADANVTGLRQSA